MSQRQPKTVVILQPSYLPWLGYFAQMEQSDVFVVYDDVQYDKESWRNRNRIKSQQGVQWLTVPALTKGENWPTNRDIRINNAVNWRRKHLNALRLNYSKAPFFLDYFSSFEELLSEDFEHLFDLNMASLKLLTKLLGLKREILLSSDLKIEGSSTERLVDICRHLFASRFYEGAAGRNYMNCVAFEQADIELVFQDYQHPRYPQLHGAFVPHLSIVDLLFNCGPQSLSILSEQTPAGTLPLPE